MEDGGGPAVAELVAQAGARAHLDRERALGAIEQLMDAGGAPWGRLGGAGAGAAAPRAGAARPSPLAPPPPLDRRRSPPRAASPPTPGGAPARGPSPDPALLAELQDGARRLVASPEWEERLGGLRLARSVLQRRVDERFAADVTAACCALLEDREVRVRWAVGETLRALCQAQGIAVWEATCPTILASIHANFERDAAEPSGQLPDPGVGSGARALGALGLRRQGLPAWLAVAASAAATAAAAGCFALTASVPASPPPPRRLPGEQRWRTVGATRRPTSWARC